MLGAAVAAEREAVHGVSGQREPAARRPGLERDAPAEPRSAVETPKQRDRAITIFERSRPGRRAFVAPPLDVPEQPLDDLLPERLRRTEPPRLPEVSEPEIVRHYNRLSKRNFDLDPASTRSGRAR